MESAVYLEALENVKQGIAVALQHRKFEMNDVVDGLVEGDVWISSTELQMAAVAYASAYEGSFSYMLDMQQALKRWKKLTTAQAKGTLNCLRAQVLKAQKPEKLEQPEKASATEPVSIINGIYTVVFGGNGSRHTIKVQDGWDGLEEGTQVAKFLSGSDNERSYTGFAFIKDGRIIMWKRYQGRDSLRLSLEVLAGSKEAQKVAGQAYALESGKCFICNRTLTTPESVALGIGPICAESFGI